MVDISVIIVSFNTKDLTFSAVSSVLKDVSNLKKEIVVVDNASTDGSVESLKKLFRQFEDNKNLNFKLVENEKNLGFSKANNQGIKLASGRYILLLNSDARLKRGTIKKLINFAENKKDAGVVVPRLLNPDGSIQGSVFRFPSITKAIAQYWLGKRGLLDKYYPKGKKPVQVEVATMACFLITPKALQKVGLLDERYFMYFEDLDYCLRIKKAGLKVYYLPNSEAIHYHGASGKWLVNQEDQWRRLIPSSKIYHGIFKHYLINFIIWSGQKWQKLIHH